MLVHAAEKTTYIVRFGDVGRFTEYQAAGRFCHFIDSARHSFARTPTDGHGCAFAQQPLGDGAADASCSTRYYRYFPGEKFVHH